MATDIYLYSIPSGQLALDNFLVASNFLREASNFFQEPAGDHVIIFTCFYVFGRHWQPTARHVEPCCGISQAQRLRWGCWGILQGQRLSEMSLWSYQI